MKYMNSARKYGAVVCGKTGAVVGVMALTASNAFATIPASVATTLTSIETDATSLFDTVTPYILSVLGMYIVIKLIKKFASKIG